MDNEQTEQPATINTPSTKTVDEAVRLIKNALDKACTRGAFTIDEAYCIKIALSTIEKALN